MFARRGPPAALGLALALSILAGGCLRGSAAPPPANPALVDDVAAARVQLEQERTAIRLSSHDPAPRRVLRLVDLGLYQDADSLLSGAPRTLDLTLAEAELRLRQYRFDEARVLVDAALAQRPGNRAARLLAVRLAIAAWQLDWAEEQTRTLLGRGRRDADAALLLGRILLLRQDDAAALEWAERVRGWPAAAAAGHLIEAEAHLLADRMPEAEAALRRALAMDPLDADARFDYGYALWRRGSPDALAAMRAQWELALELDPLHLRSHWYLGNGYTQETILDRVAIADSVARAALAPVDSLLARGDLGAALMHTRRVEGEQSASVLPALWRGSLFYLRGIEGDAAALDSAQAEFRTILSRAPGYGPAHNGVAAVLKQRQIRALASYDSLEAAIALTPAQAGVALYEVVPDLRLYPGERVGKMVAQQLGPWLAFLPLMRRQGQQLYLPPLHRDLAAATGDPSFRTATTFDHRRWMDIRGVGSPRAAAAGIEYLERGSHLDRNVLLHELVHLVHGTLLTHSQRRRVRELYLSAVADERLLDHYAGSNDLEFLAQAVEAFHAPTKAHPLNGRAMNTRAELERRDPPTFAFVHELVAELERALAGDPEALRSNRAEMYVNLARSAREEVGFGPGAGEAAVLLDSALIHDPRYLPAMLEYALLEGERGRLDRADEWMAVADGIDPGSSAVLAARAALLGLDDRGLPAAADSRLSLLQQAADREVDPLARGGYLRARWELQEAQGWLPEAIASALQFASDAPVTSTRLREIRDGAAIEVLRMRMRAGYAEEAIAPLRERLAARPHDFDLVALLADALVLAGQDAEATALLEDARRHLASAGGVHRGVQLRLAEVALAAGDSAGALTLVGPILSSPPSRRAVDGRLARLLISLGQSTEAQRQLVALPRAREPAERAELAFSRGWISAWRGDRETAERLYREALSEDPYHLDARVALVRLLRAMGRVGEADAVASLPLPAGPAFDRLVDEAG